MSLLAPLLAAWVVLSRLRPGGDFVLLLVSAMESRVLCDGSRGWAGEGVGRSGGSTYFSP